MKSSSSAGPRAPLFNEFWLSAIAVPWLVVSVWSADVAVWDLTVLAANTANLGASTNWAGIRLNGVGGNVAITNAATTLTLGGSGIDTTGSAFPLVIGCPLISGAPQDWNLISGVTLTNGLSGANNVTLIGPGTLTINNGGLLLSNLVVNSGIVSISAGKRLMPRLFAFGDDRSARLARGMLVSGQRVGNAR
jgi:hypothetical protein